MSPAKHHNTDSGLMMMDNDKAAITLSGLRHMPVAFVDFAHE